MSGGEFETRPGQKEISRDYRFSSNRPYETADFCANANPGVHPELFSAPSSGRRHRAGSELSLYLIENKAR